MKIARAAAKDRDLLFLNQLPHGARVRIIRIPIVEHDCRANRQRTQQPIPHHPTARRDVHDPVGALQVCVQEQFLEMVDQHPARPLHHAFGLTRRARREHDVERMIEGKLLEFDFELSFF